LRHRQPPQCMSCTSRSAALPTHLRICRSAQTTQSPSATAAPVMRSDVWPFLLHLAVALTYYHCAGDFTVLNTLNEKITPSGTNCRTALTTATRSCSKVSQYHYATCHQYLTWCINRVVKASSAAPPSSLLLSPPLGLANCPDPTGVSSVISHDQRRRE
jgi:hypothetical protein